MDIFVWPVSRVLNYRLHTYALHYLKLRNLQVYCMAWDWLAKFMPRDFSGHVDIGYFKAYNNMHGS